MELRAGGRKGGIIFFSPNQTVRYIKWKVSIALYSFNMGCKVVEWGLKSTTQILTKKIWWHPYVKSRPHTDLCSNKIDNSTLLHFAIIVDYSLGLHWYWKIWRESHCYWQRNSRSNISISRDYALQLRRMPTLAASE